MNRKEIIDKFRQTIYYWIIFFTSCVVLIFMPMIGSEAGLTFNIPQTVAGWCVYIVTKLLVAVLNVVIFFSFMQQAKLNIKDDPNYKQACDILGKVRHTKEYIPRNPKKWERKQYLSKGSKIFLSSAAGLIALANAFLTYDYMSLLSYGITIILGIIFGLLQMSTAEEYWTREFLDYALMIKREAEISPIIILDQESNIDSNKEQNNKGD